VRSGEASAGFSVQELEYLLGERRLGRLATADADGRPHVVPVGWSYNAELGTIDVSGHAFASTKKFRNARDNPHAAFVVDDVLPPWRPRGVTVQGAAETIDGGGTARRWSGSIPAPLSRGASTPS
jgi:pyridoxamine 5'-phosphate oxidase family protein